MENYSEEYNEILNIFQVESEEIISRLNSSFVELENKSNNKDIIMQIFRDAHSLKGASRMIGFNNVQTIAHKMEDIIGLAKDNKLQLNAKIADILYKTVDFLSEYIQESIVNREEVEKDSIQQQLSTLDNLMNTEEFEAAPKENEGYNIELLKNSAEEINKKLTEILVYLMRMELKVTTALIENVLICSDFLFNKFKDIGFFEIKMGIENIKVKLEFVKNTSGYLTAQEIQEVQNELNNVIINFTSVCEINNIPQIDYYSLAFEALSSEQDLNAIDLEFQTKENFTITDEISSTKSKNLSNQFDLKKLEEKISTLKSSTVNASEISTYLASFRKYTKNSGVGIVVDKMISILKFVENNNALLDENTISVLQQCIEFCDNKVKNLDESTDVELISQRLTILEQLLELNLNNQGAIDFPAMAQDIGKPQKPADFTKIFDTGEIKTLRVNSQKLDALVNQVGEMIITKIKSEKRLEELELVKDNIEEWQNTFNKTVSHLKYYDKKHSQIESDSNSIFFIKQLMNLINQNNKEMTSAIFNLGSLYRTIQEDDLKMDILINDLKDMIKNIRVLPLATVFHLFGRMVRDIAKEKNKKIELEIIGSETSVDKKIIEEIKTPLIHIIRNAIDHGIETPELRVAAGKNPIGKITLSAKHLDNKVLIEVIDDGYGMNIGKIRRKAVEKGFLTEEEADGMSDEEITNLIFYPGFTTGEEITNISGRGIGLDVVQTKIAQLNGKVKVISEMGVGSCLQIELPITMATLKSFLIKCGGQTFAIPMNGVSSIIRKKTSDISEKNGIQTVDFNGTIIPVYFISDILNITEEPSDKPFKTIIVVENENKFMGLVINKLIGDQEILHKKLSAPLYKLKNISGITTLASGEICLILSVSDIIKNATGSKTTLLAKKEVADSKIKNSFSKILIVDDSITTRKLESNILKSAGFKIETATNPVEALDKMKVTNFNLIISDIEMPEMNGFEFLEKIKTNEMFADIPVLMVSSINKEEYRKEAIYRGAFDFIDKSEFNQQSFLKLVEKVTRK